MSLAMDLMVAARTTLLREQPFFGTLAMYLKLVEDENCKTAAVDGEHLFFAPTFIVPLSPRKRVGLFAHEVLHCILKHHLRRGTRDHEMFNDACDFAINLNLIRSKFDLPDGGLWDDKYDGMTAEEIYARIRDAQQQPQGGQGDQQQNQQASGQRDQSDASSGASPGTGNGKDQPGNSSQADASGQAGSSVDQQGTPKDGKGASTGQSGSDTPKSPGPGKWGRVLDGAKPTDEAKISQQAATWDARTRAALAVAAARNEGRIPGELLGIAEEVKTKRSDFNAGLRRFINDRCNTDQSWQQPNKRMLGSGFIFPGEVPDGIRKMGMIIDTSGSVNNRLLGLFIARLQDALAEVDIEELIVMQCDAKVQKIDRFAKGDIIKVNVVGRGGTRFSPALDWFEKNEPEVAALMYFTDLECTDWGKDPGMPLLWAVYGYESVVKGRAAPVPFGEVIMVTE